MNVPGRRIVLHFDASPILLYGRSWLFASWGEPAKWQHGKMLYSNNNNKNSNSCSIVAVVAFMVVVVIVVGVAAAVVV